MFNWILNQLEGKEVRDEAGWKCKMAGHVRRPTLSKGEPKSTLRCSNAEALFQVPAGPFRSSYPLGRYSAASEQLDFTICGTFFFFNAPPGSPEGSVPLGCRKQVNCS